METKKADIENSIKSSIKKQNEKKELEAIERIKSKLLAEGTALSRCQHPHIVKFEIPFIDRGRILKYGS